MDTYDCLNKAQLSFEYLHTNSTTHTFLFGAIAELVDNSRDAAAKNLDIYTCKDSSLRGGFYLAFLDDGCGMQYDDVFNIIVFGKSAKRHAPDSNQIGQYGNGLKSGAMRIANDFILFTKKDNIGTCLFLSRSFHQQEHISQVICPMPCFDLRTRQPIQNTDFDQLSGTRNYTFDSSKHEIEMNLIFKYSPFKTMKEFFEQFDSISSPSGTLIVLYNVKLSESGDPELDIRSDPKDILIDSRNSRTLFADDEDSSPAEYRSLRSYVSILYYEPRMRITIQHRRVITKRLPYSLYKPRQYQFKSSRFKTRSEQEIKKCENELISLEERYREADSQVHHAQKLIGVTTSLDERKRLRKLQIHAAELKDMIARLRNGLTRKRTELNTTKTLTFIFGLNIQNRAADGVFVYNCGRLIKMYEKIGQPNKKTVYCRGVIGIVDIPSIVLEPTHNKQSFADEKEYHFLLKNIGDHMRQYWSDTGIENYVKEFWETYGYRDDQLDRPPSNEPEAVKHRQLAVPILIQCDKCLKWRRLPYSGNNSTLAPAQLETWRCSDNTDVMNNSCSISEKIESIPEGELKSKPTINTNQTRPSPRPASPPPSSSSSASITRSSSTQKRVSNGEISSTTATSKTKPALQSPVEVISSRAPTKRSLPPSRSLSAKAKTPKKRKSSASNQKKKVSTKSRSTVSDDESDDEKDEQTNDDDNTVDDEVDEDLSPSRRSTRTSKNPAPATSNRTSRSINNSRQTTSSTNIKQSNPSEIITSTNSVQVIDDDEESPSPGHISQTLPPTIGARVIAMYQGARRPGRVISVNDKRGIFKMRFDEFPSAEFDYSFSFKSLSWSYINSPAKSPTVTETTTNEPEPLSTIAKKFKALLKFMLPPEWSLTREEISSMSFDELSQFDVETFMQSYREKMMKIVEQRKAEENRWRSTAQRLQAEVTTLLNAKGMPIPADCSIDDFEKSIQNYTNRSERRRH